MPARLLHLHCDLTAALRIVAHWWEYPQGVPLEGEPRREDNGWATLPLDCDFMPAARWSTLARDADLFYESFDQGRGWAEIVCFVASRPVRHLRISGDPEESLDEGALRAEPGASLQSWSEVRAFMDGARWREEVRPGG